MSVILFDLESGESGFSVNFWHWRTIVEAIRATHSLPDEQVDLLHQPFVGGLREREARIVGRALRAVTATLSPDDRLLLDGTTTADPDDHTLYWDEWHRNYSTNRRILEQFIAYCDTCHGFSIG